MTEQREYEYVNDLGLRKKLVVHGKKEDGSIFTTLWCLENGELTGFGYAKPEELKKFLKHYGIVYEVEEDHAAVHSDDPGADHGVLDGVECGERPGG